MRTLRAGRRSQPADPDGQLGRPSGSRLVCREKVLGGEQELGITSDDCRRDDDAATTKYHRCEVGTTEELLTRVNKIDGAIGYAGSARKYPQLTPVTIDGVVPRTTGARPG